MSVLNVLSMYNVELKIMLNEFEKECKTKRNSSEKNEIKMQLIKTASQ